eukprot:CAMPEP_0116882712 /NCGR_PEP_ID=MMETSP0463-20121206/15058_1 /TAXON_ID=181622 /ORGANISM="Strombidinopsis sp, Strain SopsisLIS2011" /LENGTH=77 /DNA_ID=CAMNT_0004536399 /DNA_START=335 /DNA_END=568 /DNA_ORIENTATION=+
MDNILTPDAKVTSDWVLQSVESTTTCTGTSPDIVCTLVCEFERLYETEDTSDYAITKGDDQIFAATGYFHSVNKGNG